MIVDLLLSFIQIVLSNSYTKLYCDYLFLLYYSNTDHQKLLYPAITLRRITSKIAEPIGFKFINDFAQDNTIDITFVTAGLPRHRIRSLCLRLSEFQ